MPEVSIVLPSYNRYHQARRTLQSIFAQNYEGLEVILVDDGSTDRTPKLKSEFPIRYFRLERPGWANPSLPLNVGIRRARGKFLILNGAETRHETPDAIARFVAILRQEPTAWVFATVRAEVRDTDGMLMDYQDYVSPKRPRPAWFMSALMRKHMVAIRGFDEDFTAAGFDDDDIADRLLTRGVGLHPVYAADIVGIHQWHPPSPYDIPEGRAGEMQVLYQKKTAAWERGEINHVRNLDHEWGQLPKAYA